MLPLQGHPRHREQGEGIAMPYIRTSKEQAEDITLILDDEKERKKDEDTRDSKKTGADRKKRKS